MLSYIAENKSIKCLKEAFQKFAATSGPQIINSKSHVNIGGVDTNTKEELIQKSGVVKGQLHLRYLGVPILPLKLSGMSVKYL